MERQSEPIAPTPAPAPESPAPAIAPALGSPAAVLGLQRSAGNAAVESMLRRDEAAAKPGVYRSPALELRSQLRTLQRAVSTPFGEFDTEEYEAKKDEAGGKAFPAAAGVRGVNIKLAFKPGNQVDAEEIGMTQSVTSVVVGKPQLSAGAAQRPISAGDAKPTGVGTETDEGTAIDQAGDANNPLYATENTDSKSLAGEAADAKFGQHGFHFKDDKGALKEQSAKLFDGPRRGGAAKDSRQVFEATALATKGKQAGTYYGSVRWGWRTDDKGGFDKIPLAKVSEGVPSSTFLKAGEVWNASKVKGTGKDTVDLPIPDVKLVSGTVRIKRPTGDIALPAGTRVVITRVPRGTVLGCIRVVDGMHIDLAGDVPAEDWANITDERS